MRKIKGFTLVECIVALAILGITSLLLCQAYTQLMKVTNINNTAYMSLADQMQDAEISSDGRAKLVGSDVTKKEYSSTEGHTVKVVRIKKPNRGTATYDQYFSGGSGKFISNVEVYVSDTYDDHHRDSTHMVADADSGTDKRYIYFHR